MPAAKEDKSPRQPTARPAAPELAAPSWPVSIQEQPILDLVATLQDPANLRNVLNTFAKSDVDGVGRVKWPDFSKAVLSLGATHRAEVVSCLFALLDTNGSGSIEYKGLAARLRKTDFVKELWAAKVRRSYGF